MSSIVTTARTDLAPLHNPPPYRRGPLQPAMSPRLAPAPDALPAPTGLKDDKLGEPSRSMATSASMRKIDMLKRSTAAGLPPAPPPAAGASASASATGGATSAADARAVLARVNVNVSSSLHKRVLGRAGPSSAKMIPRPAATPDVFAPEPSTARASPATATATPGSLGKRARDSPLPPSVIAKRPRADVTAAAAKHHKEEQERWLQKWQKVFPTLVFHFEIGLEDGCGRLGPRVLKMGARIDQFFSQRVSHLIVKGGTSPQKPKAVSKGRHPGRESDNPFLDHTGTTDLVQKAQKLGIKVWTVKKLTDMLNKLAPVDATVKDSLSHLLADEKLNGTRERDMTAPRADYYYFKPGNGYLLVEDATKHSRPIMVKEYPAKEREWPVLHEQFLRLTTSSQLPTSVANSSNLVKDLRARAMALFVDNVPFRNEQPPVPTLKRSNSLRELPVTPTLPESLPYLKASGNSVVITSNIASTSNANATPGTFVGGVPALGTARDRAIIQMSKRVQVLKGNARLAATVSAKKLTDADRRGVVDETPAPGPHRRRSTGMDAAPTPPVKEFLTQAQVVAMLHQLHAPTTMRKPTYDERVTNRQHVNSGFKRKEQDTASGYCENCRIRYTNLSVHVASKKHRRFATNPKNFADLDDMLQCLQRPPNPAICHPTKVCRPCYRRHDKNAQCGRCMDDPALYSSPPTSPAGSTVPRSARKPRVLGGAFDDGGTEDGSNYNASEDGYPGRDDPPWDTDDDLFITDDR